MINFSPKVDETKFICNQSAFTIAFEDFKK